MALSRLSSAFTAIARGQWVSHKAQPGVKLVSPLLFVVRVVLPRSGLLARPQILFFLAGCYVYNPKVQKNSVSVESVEVGVDERLSD